MTPPASQPMIAHLLWSTFEAHLLQIRAGTNEVRAGVDKALNLLKQQRETMSADEVAALLQQSEDA